VQVVQLRGGLPTLCELVRKLTSDIRERRTGRFRLIPTLHVGEALSGLVVDVHLPGRNNNRKLADSCTLETGKQGRNEPSGSIEIRTVQDAKGL
jgi:hypothetical protein